MGNISMKLFKFGPVVQIEMLIDKKVYGRTHARRSTKTNHNIWLRRAKKEQPHVNRQVIVVVVS